MKKEMRKTYLIKKGFQTRFIVIILLLVIIVANITGGLVYAIMKVEVARESFLSYLNIDESEDLLLPVVLVAELISIFIVAVISLFVSHRIAGPVYRFERVCEAVAQGKLDFQIRLREKDEFKELAEAFNRMLTSLKEKIVNFEDIYKQLTETVPPVDEAKKETKKELLEKIMNMKSVFGQFEQKLAWFKFDKFDKND